MAEKKETHSSERRPETAPSSRPGSPAKGPTAKRDGHELSDADLTKVAGGEASEPSFGEVTVTTKAAKSTPKLFME